MFCLHCGNAIEEGDAFCEGCGHRIETPQYATCAHCGQLLESADAFCEFCGNKTGNNVGGAGAGSRQQGIAATGFPSPPATANASSAHTPPVSPGPTYAPSAPPGAAYTPAASPGSAYPPSTPPTTQPRMLLILLINTSASTVLYANQLLIYLSRFIIDVSADDIAQNALDMSIIQFNDSFNVLQDLPDVPNAGSPQFTTGGNACYSGPINEALRMTLEYSRNYAHTFKPWVVMITSGEPSDDISAISWEIQRMQSAEQLRFMALGVLDYDTASLKMLTDVVFRQNGTDFTSFFDWLSKSIKAIVRTSPGEKPHLPPLQGDVYRDR